MTRGGGGEGGPANDEKGGSLRTSVCRGDTLICLLTLFHFNDYSTFLVLLALSTHQLDKLDSRPHDLNFLSSACILWKKGAFSGSWSSLG